MTKSKCGLWLNHVNIWICFEPFYYSSCPARNNFPAWFSSRVALFLLLKKSIPHKINYLWFIMTMVLLWCWTELISHHTCMHVCILTTKFSFGLNQPEEFLYMFYVPCKQIELLRVRSHGPKCQDQEGQDYMYSRWLKPSESLQCYVRFGRVNFWHFCCNAWVSTNESVSLYWRCLTSTLSTQPRSTIV